MSHMYVYKYIFINEYVWFHDTPFQQTPIRVCFIGKWPGKGPHREDLDETRQKQAGTPLSEHFAVVEYRGDWSPGIFTCFD